MLIRGLGSTVIGGDRGGMAPRSGGGTCTFLRSLRMLSQRVLGSRARGRVVDRDDLVSVYLDSFAAGSSPLHLISKVLLLELLLLGVVRSDEKSIRLMTNARIFQ